MVEKKTEMRMLWANFQLPVLIVNAFNFNPNTIFGGFFKFIFGKYWFFLDFDSPMLEATVIDKSIAVLSLVYLTFQFK